MRRFHLLMLSLPLAVCLSTPHAGAEKPAQSGKSKKSGGESSKSKQASSKKKAPAKQKAGGKDAFKEFATSKFTISAPSHWELEKLVEGLWVLRGNRGKLYVHVGPKSKGKPKEVWESFIKKTLKSRIVDVRLRKPKVFSGDKRTYVFGSFKGKSRTEKGGTPAAGPRFRFAALTTGANRTIGFALGGTPGAWMKQRARLLKLAQSLKLK